MPPNYTAHDIATMDSPRYSSSPKAGAIPAKPTSQEKEKKSLPSVDDIRRAIPRECFERSLPHSLSYLVLDYGILAALYFMEPYFESYGGWTGLLIWYWLMGMFGMALFVAGHECDHGSFSEYEWVNDICGHFAHAPLLTSYWPWQKSHRGHHTFTNHIEKDMSHPWYTEEDLAGFSWFSRIFWNSPVVMFFKFNVVYQILGYPDGSHYWPFSKLFVTKEERIKCAFSTSLCLLSLTVAYWWCDYSLASTLKYYLIPVLCQSFWVFMITYLHHHEPNTAVYDEGTWTYVKGQLQTVDRYYGFGVDWLLHHITDCHVTHHLFPKIPHYHLPRATKAVRSFLNDNYPGSYKRMHSLHFVFELLRLNWLLEYLIPIGKGTFGFPAIKRENTSSCGSRKML